MLNVLSQTASLTANAVQRGRVRIKANVSPLRKATKISESVMIGLDKWGALADALSATAVSARCARIEFRDIGHVSSVAAAAARSAAGSLMP
jgi:hypothetical protein